MKYIQSIFITLTLLIFKCTCSADEKPTLGDADFPAPSPSKRHDKKVIQVKNGKYDLLLIGDSITHSIGELEGKYDVKVNVNGGGNTGQADAIKLAISRALCELDIENRKTLKAEGLLTRDPRVVERKKPGQKKARKKFQWVKR